MLDGSFEPVETITYNAFIITKNYHERNIIRAFKLRNKIPFAIEAAKSSNICNVRQKDIENEKECNS